MAPAGELSQSWLSARVRDGQPPESVRTRTQPSGLFDEFVDALEHAEADCTQAGYDSLDDAHRVVEPLVALVVGLEPHHDVLSSDALPFRVLAEDRPPLHDKGDLCPVLRSHKAPAGGQHPSAASSSL